MPRPAVPSISPNTAEDAIDVATGALGRLGADVEHTQRLEMLGLLSAGIAHEINNILTPVLAYAQMAAASPSDAELTAKAIEKTVLGVENATRIASSILGFAGPDSDPMDSDVEETVAQSLRCTVHNPNTNRLEIQVDVQPGTRARISSLNLQQVLMNVILNAESAMLEHGRPGRLVIAALPRADGTVAIRVSDNGPGIPRDIAGKIFEPFITTKRTDSVGASGTAAKSGKSCGLGLAICKRLIEHAGGTITASSTAGQGTTFLIVLPSPQSRRAKAG